MKAGGAQSVAHVSLAAVVDDKLVRGSEVKVNKFYDHLRVRFDIDLSVRNLPS